jgi:hypothetical protein
MKSKLIAGAAVAGAIADMIAGNDLGANNAPGSMYFANESRFVEANFSEPLTTYAIGWKDPNNIEATLEFVAPKVQTSRRFEFGKASNAEEFLSETDDVRAIGADFKRVEFTSEKESAKTLNKGLTIRVDLDNVEGNPNWRELYTGRLMRRLYRNELRRAIALLVAAGANTAKTWNTDAGKDPDQDIAALVIAFQDAAGINPNRGLYGTVAWNKRRISHRAQNTAGGFASAGMTEAEVAGYLGLDEVRVSKERYQSAAATKSKVLGDYVLLFMAESNATAEDPSNIKRFVSPTTGGTPFRVYEQQINAKLIDITVEHYSNIIVTSTLGIQKATIS